MATMRAIEIPEPGGPEALSLTRRPVPEPGEGEVLIKVAAAGVNRPDAMQRAGDYPPPPGASDIPGLEVSGTVEALGEGVTRYRVGGKRASLIDLDLRPEMPRATAGAGSVHHIAFAVPDRAAQLQVREALIAAGHEVTPVIDRSYFRAIYFRTPAGILFEIATDEPGFETDEPVATLGEALVLPPQHEPLREQLERSLPPL